MAGRCAWRSFAPAHQWDTFERSFALPENVDTTAIRAGTKDGVLRIHIPKKEPAKAKPISIEVK